MSNATSTIKKGNSTEKSTGIMGINIRQSAMLIALIVIIVVFQVLTKGVLLTPQNISNMVNQNGYILVLAIGMLCCILTGGNIDLSVGSVCATIGAITGTLIISWKMNVYLSIAIGLFCGALIGIWQGFWIAYVKIPPFIVTLTGMLIFRGLTNVILVGGKTLSPYPASYKMLVTGFIHDPLGQKAFLIAGKEFSVYLTTLIIGLIAAGVYILLQIFKRIRRTKSGYHVEQSWMFIVKTAVLAIVIIAFALILSQYRGMPTVLILLSALIFGYSYFTQNTVAGRHVYALGGNAKAAELSGIKTKKVMFGVYVNMSILAAVAGIVFSARLDSASPLSGQGFEMDAIASCFLGGASAYGGTGTVSGAIIGALFMGVINNGMSIMGVGPAMQMVIKGLVLLAAVAFDILSKSKNKA